MIWSAHLVKHRGFDREAQDKFSRALQYTEGYFYKFSTNRFINEPIWITQVHRWTCMNYTDSSMNAYMNYTDSSINCWIYMLMNLYKSILPIYTWSLRVTPLARILKQQIVNHNLNKGIYPLLIIDQEDNRKDILLEDYFNQQMLTLIDYHTKRECLITYQECSFNSDACKVL